MKFPTATLLLCLITARDAMTSAFTIPPMPPLASSYHRTRKTTTSSSLSMALFGPPPPPVDNPINSRPTVSLDGGNNLNSPPLELRAGGASINNANADGPMPVLQSIGGQPAEPRYGDFIRLLKANQIEKATFSADGNVLNGVDAEGTRFKIDPLPNDPSLVEELYAHDVDVVVRTEDESSGLGDLAQSLILPAALFAGLFFLSRRSGGLGGGGGLGGPGNPLGFAKSKAQVDVIPDTGISFEDVAGCEEAKKELEEVVDFLKRPDAYTRQGAIIPRGVILDGPPGTGKTLLAKAVAGEASVPFISVSGSEFVEMFVGVGASRVRDIFNQAKKNAPCIIFIDEIDAVGRQRGAGYAGGNDEREQTINQILTELDGFVGNPGIITIAATNRVDILDQALLRPGRFDRKVTVDLPDFKGREKILGVHSRGKPLEPDVDLEAIARRTPGFSGADLANMMNEAAITAARAGKATVGWEEIDAAVDRILVGLEKKGVAQVVKRKELVAYHESGHAIVGALIPDYDQVQKITIIPRSNGAGGLTFFAPSDLRLDSEAYSKQYLESQIACALGGRLAEELVYGEAGVTAGASNDIQQVANIAKRMVKEWGMSDRVGPMAIQTPQEGGPFMGRMMGTPRTHWGSIIQGDADAEVERMVNNAYLTAKKILTDNRALLDHLAGTLADQEVVAAEEFQMMLVQFRANTLEFGVFPEELNRDQLPFQSLPATTTDM